MCYLLNDGKTLLWRILSPEHIHLNTKWMRFYRHNHLWLQTHGSSVFSCYGRGLFLNFGKFHWLYYDCVCATCKTLIRTNWKWKTTNITMLLCRTRNLLIYTYRPSEQIEWWIVWSNRWNVLMSVCISEKRNYFIIALIYCTNNSL